uniref:LRAT domain-containing protein n=1 Tax=Panagrolaimus davidi TaxID=227884 RepID=A0A914QXE0_9BILA
MDRARVSRWYSKQEKQQLLNELHTGDLIECKNDNPFIHHYAVYIGTNDEGIHEVMDRTGALRLKSIFWFVVRRATRITKCNVIDFYNDFTHC